MPIVFVAWSLSYEMFFYAFASLFVLGGRIYQVPRRKRIVGLAFVLYPACLLISGIFFISIERPFSLRSATTTLPTVVVSG